jgi:hypothetical protein
MLLYFNNVIIIINIYVPEPSLALAFFSFYVLSFWTLNKAFISLSLSGWTRMGARFYRDVVAVKIYNELFESDF